MIFVCDKCLNSFIETVNTEKINLCFVKKIVFYLCGILQITYVY